MAQSPNHADDGIVDIADALARLEGNKELLGQIVQIFLEQYPRLLTESHQSLSSADCHALTRAVHTLGSSAGQVGATRALRMAWQIQDLAESRDLANVLAILAAWRRKSSWLNPRWLHKALFPRLRLNPDCAVKIATDTTLGPTDENLQFIRGIENLTEFQ